MSSMREGFSASTHFMGYWALLLLACTLGVFLGSVSWSVGEVRGALRELWHQSPSPEAAILEIRLTRVAAAALVGGGLALAGSVLQRLLRNPLADPFVLGISSGGTVAAALVSVLGLPFLWFGVPVKMLAAFAGCLLTLALILSAKRLLRHLQDEYAIPVLGMVLNAFLGAVIMVFVSVAEQSRVQEVYRWMVGSLQLIGLRELLVLALVVLSASAALIRLAGPINTLSFGDDFSRSLGFPASRLRRTALLLVALMVAALVAVSGSVGFVGLIVPHVVRRFHRESVRQEWLASALVGALVLVVGDLLARTVAAPSELPVGLFTALLGAPALAVLLTRERPRAG